MENLAEYNLFTSHFVMGGNVSDTKKIGLVQALNEWLEYKDTNPDMKKYRTERTQYIDFLHIIEISVLKDILYKLMMIYKKSYPYGVKDDFIQHTFRYTLYDLETIISRDYIFYCHLINGYAFYYFYDKESLEYIDVAISSDKDIDYYRQYYKTIINLINSIEFETPQMNSLLIENNSLPKSETITEIIDKNYPQVGKIKKLTLREIALYYYFKGEKITHTNQGEFAKRHGQDNKGKKLYKEHYFLILESEIEIYQPKYAKKYLKNVQELFDKDSTKYKEIEVFIKKSK